MEWVILAARLFIAATLCLAGVMKLRAGPAAFAQAVRGYDLLPARLVTPIATTLPPFEVALGVLLLAGAMTRPAAAAACVVLVAFALAVAANLVRGRENDCGCFGQQRSRIAWRVVQRNAALAATAFLVLLAGPGAVALDATILGGVR
ncbi:MAG: DoxX family membrane protein [Chloroflexi bacterium]|nr:MAG: DoxX family membrane protein [Chloroflexota bacterium]TMC27854.1 MAG: DoxX family membrane protein [Chloroflexota bacterium]TME36271.1 MAG: DoxX family membrane protein [Chloroflexota bacterium]